MTKSFNDIQKRFYTSAEEKRFYWQTKNPYIKQKECELLSSIKDLIQADDKILEVGCGEGANIKHFRTLGILNNIIGVDFLKEKIDFCSGLGFENVHFQVADARELPFDNNSFEITFTRDLLHHVNEERPKVIEELLRVTKPNGHLIVIEGNVEKFTNYVFANVFAHERGMKDSTKEKMIKLVESYDYQLSSHEPSNFFRFVLHYNFGMPYLAKLKIVCKLLDLQQSIFKKLLPERKWAYQVIKINKPLN